MTRCKLVSESMLAGRYQLDIKNSVPFDFFVTARICSQLSAIFAIPVSSL